MAFFPLLQSFFSQLKGISQLDFPVHNVIYIPRKYGGKEANKTSLAKSRRRDFAPKLRNYLLSIGLTAAQLDSWSGLKGRPGQRQSHWVLGQTDDAHPQSAHGLSLLLTSQPGFGGRLLEFGGHFPSASDRHCLKGKLEAQNGGSCYPLIHSPVQTRNSQLEI